MMNSKNAGGGKLDTLLEDVASQARVSKRRAMVDIALRVAEEAAIGAVGSQDADRIYTKFRDETTETDEGQGESSRASQVSKLRKIIELGAVMGKPAKAILERVVDVHESVNKGERKIKSTYEVLVWVAREQLKRPRRPFSDDEIRRLVIKPEPNDYEAVARDELRRATDAVLTALRRRRGAKKRLKQILDVKARGRGGSQP